MISSRKQEDSNHLVEDITQKYATVMEMNFTKKQNQLVEELLAKAKVLKDQISYFKKETSQENIQKLIVQKRREKERQRQKLESRWRECNQSFKKLQEEQKRMTNERKENIFDLKNLENKIREFKQNIDKIQRKVEESQKFENHFVTGIKENYQSPYSAFTSKHEPTIEKISKDQRLFAKTQKHFVTSKYNFSQTDNVLRSHARLSNFKNQLSSFSDISNAAQPAKCDILKTEVSKFDCSEVGRTTESGNLMLFLNDRAVRLKIFRFLSRKI